MMDPMLVYRSKAQGGIYKRGRMQRVWFRDVKVGDVLVDPWGNERIVRKVSRYTNGDLHYLHFVKQRCSKFKRAGTLYLFTELRIGGWRPTGVNVQLGSELDFMIEVEINTLPNPPLMSCCDVRGMA